MFKKITFALFTLVILWLLYSTFKPAITEKAKIEDKTTTSINTSVKTEELIPKETVEDSAYAFIPDFNYRQGDVVPVEIKNFIKKDFDRYEIKTNIKGDFSALEIYMLDGLPFALIPITSSTKPDIYKVEVYKNEKLLSTTIFKVNKREFEIQHLSINKSFEEKKTPENLESDKNALKNAKKTSSTTPLFTKKFIYPVKDYSVTTSFQAIRFVNDTNIIYRHSGIDMAVPKGTPIECSNSGKVTFAGETVSGGNTVIVDHGLGIFTQYMHMDKIHVKKDQELKQGEILGEVGTTGFSTGAHLHFDACIENTYVDPEQLINYNILNNLE